jgi:hypothetical protein
MCVAAGDEPLFPTTNGFDANGSAGMLTRNLSEISARL